MTRFGRSLGREIAPLFAAGVSVLVVLLLLSFLLGVLADVIARGVPVPLVALFLLLKLPSAIGVGMPLALLFAALLALTRASQDGEIAAALMLGLSPRAFLVPLLVLGVAVSLLTATSNEVVVPWAERRALEVQRDILLRSPETLVQPGSFFQDALGRSIFIDRVDAGGAFYGVTVITAGGAQGPRQVIRAERGRSNAAAGVWELEGLEFRTYRRSRTVIEARAERATLPVRGLTAGVVGTPDLVTLPLPALLTRIRTAGTDVAAEWTAIHRKAAQPLAAVAFAIFALAVALTSFRRATPLGLVAVMALTFVYYATWSVANLLGAQGTIPAWIAGWAPVALYAVAGGALLVTSWRR
ncbi:LptF/LptG family permease [soil metagenome]|nr:LptF/LptG family permease [Trueperaceae bacterium]